MRAVLLHLRAELRSRWRALLGAAVLVGVIGGLVIGAVAGARRTDSSFDRLLAETDSWDVLVNPNIGIDTGLTIQHLSGAEVVEEVTAVYGLPVFFLDADGLPLSDFSTLTLGVGDAHGVVDFARPKVVEGRLFDHRQADEVMVSPSLAASYDLAPGDTLAVGYAGLGPLIEFEESGGEGLPPMDRLELTVAGVVVPPEEVVRDEVFSYDTMFLSHAFTAEHLDDAYFVAYVTRLADRPGAFADLQREVAAAVPGELVEYQRMSGIAETVDRGVRPHVVALLAFAAVIGLAGSVLAVQATGRQLEPMARDARALSSLGLDRRDLVRAAMVRTAIIGAAAAIVAVAVAIAMSPLFPVGVAEQAEVDPGLDIDRVVLTFGAVAVLTGTVAGSWRTARRAAGRGRRPRSLTGRDRTATRLTGVTGGPVTGSGLRLAFGRGTSLRPAVAGLAFALAAVAATATFGTSLASFVGSPPAYGWTWDALVSTSTEHDAAATAAMIDRFEREEAFDGLSAGIIDQLSIGDHRVTALGVDHVRAEVGPPVVDGRAPTAPDEIALGGRTIDALGVAIGDRLSVGTARRPFTVVGQAVFVGMGTYSGADRTGLGDGALLTVDGLRSVGEGFGFPFLLVDAEEPAGLEHGLAEIRRQFQPEIENGSVEILAEPQRPADVVNLERVEQTPVLITGVLLVLAGAAFVHALRSSSRGRRRELALLKTMGMSRRGLVGVVTVQSMATVAAACLVGIPLGVAAGRWAWMVLAEQLGIVFTADVPVALLGLLPAALAGAALVALGPATRAARTHAATVLREE